MQTKILGFCRYSVITHDGGAWKVGKNQPWDDYRATVLDPERLAKRLYFLQHMLLPSIAGQTLPPAPDWFRLCLLVSDQLPSQAQAALMDVVAGYPWCQVVPVSAERGALGKAVNQALKAFVEEDDLFITFRIDDDDALGKRYLEHLQSYGSETFRGHAISFPFGYKAWFDHAEDRYTRVAEHWQPKIALGLAYVGHRRDKVQHVFQAGGHNQVDRRSPLLTLPAGPMYLRTFHQDNDVLSVAKNPKQLANSVEQRFAEGEPVALAGLDKHFSLSLAAAPSDELNAIGVKQ
uniref:glycosyltransferase n=1 Tax=uncultured Halomonas sp. TaxID=173971 RepID=UPI00262D22C9|nr:glycosyltransferase [uncultured Halomonas sp.]